MLNSVSIITALLAAPVLVANVLAQVELWQRKEYRLDRLRASYSEPGVVGRLIVYGIALSAALLQMPHITLLTFLLAHAWRVVRRGVYRPRFTVKAITLLGIAGALLVPTATVSLTRWPAAAAWAIVLLLAPLATALAATLVNRIAERRKRQIITRAQQLRSSLPDLTVVGITGSVGKTSVKHFLAQLIPGAVATKKHRNAEFPVAQDMLEQLFTRRTGGRRPPTIYIAEMGAYTKGEIAALAALTQPRIGVITTIGNQHLATFGSPKNILAAKWELIDALPKGGIAVLNADDQRLMHQARKINAPLEYSTTHPADIFADAISIQPRSISCRLHIQQTIREVAIPLAGEAALSNVLAAIAAATATGESAENIFSRLPGLKPFPRTMEIKNGREGATVLDDSYSASEHSVLEAVRHLQRFPEPDKRIILVPLIELGSAAAAVHQQLGETIRAAGISAFVYGTAFARELGLPAFKHPHTLMQAATRGLSSDSVVLLEGRLPEIVREALITKKA